MLLILSRVIESCHYAHRHEEYGCLWKPVNNILKDYFDITLANAQRIKNVPRRKTDVADAEWIAKLFDMDTLKKGF